MFSNFAERVAQKFKELGPQDELDKAIASLVSAGCDPELLGPDWGVNMQLVDIVNRQPSEGSEKLLRVVNRTMGRPSAKQQLLVLTMLDTCVRNCHPTLHIQLGSSLLWADLIKLAQDTGVSRVSGSLADSLHCVQGSLLPDALSLLQQSAKSIDAEVRDKILAMVEDYGRWLAVPPAFQDTYNTLVEQGVDFPVRSAADMSPIEVYQPPTLSAAGVGPGAGLGAVPGARAGAASGDPGGEGADHGHGLRAPGPEAFEGMSDEDRAAVQAAMAELAMDEAAAQEAAAVAAAADASERQAMAQQAASALASAQPQPLPLRPTTDGSSPRGGPTPTPAPWQASGPPLPSSSPTAAQRMQGSEQGQGLFGQGHGLFESLAVWTGGLGGGRSARSTREQSGAGAGPQGQGQGPQGQGQGQGQQGGPLPRREPEVPEDPVKALELMTASISLFQELVMAVPDSEPCGVRDPLVQDLAEQCSLYRSKLMNLAASLTDEQLLISALAQNDTLSSAMARYDELLAHALSVPVTPTLSVLSTSDGAESELAARAAAATSAIRDHSNSGAAQRSGANFTLIEEDEEEEEGGALATKRAPVEAASQEPASGHAVALAAGQVSVAVSNGSGQLANPTLSEEQPALHGAVGAVAPKPLD
ncbi:hypothetical protein QJQ45_017021 [Haematococcus lacustris]|nr:hypothetical protein QJQ45_017021 [Haematococcus lacustris]